MLHSLTEAYKRADGKKVDGRRLLVDVERGRTVKGWLPRRLGGGLGNTRKGGPDENTRYSGREESRRPDSRYEIFATALVHADDLIILTESAIVSAGLEVRTTETGIVTGTETGLEVGVRTVGTEKERSVIPETGK